VSNHQGKFHLIVIFSVPVLAMLLFIVQNWWITTTYFLILTVVTVALFRKK